MHSTSVYILYNILSLQASMSFVKIGAGRPFFFLTVVSKIIFRARSLRRYYVLKVKNAVVTFVYCVTSYTICNRVL